MNNSCCYDVCVRCSKELCNNACTKIGPSIRSVTNRFDRLRTEHKSNQTVTAVGIDVEFTSLVTNRFVVTNRG